MQTRYPSEGEALRISAFLISWSSMYSGIRKLCMEQLRTADNMTDVMASLANVANTDCPERPDALSGFYEIWKDDPLVMDKWLSIQGPCRAFLRPSRQ